MNRDQMIETLLEDDYDCDHWDALKSVLLFGFEGYVNMDDDGLYEILRNRGLADEPPTTV